MTSGIWAFIILVGVFVFLAGMVAYVVEDRDRRVKQAEDANAALHAQIAELRRYSDKQNYHLSNLMVENYELHVLINQAHGQGFVPKKFRQGREN